MPTPFDADPADPIVLVPEWCTRLDERGATQLKAQLPLRNSAGTVRWQTFGLDRTLEPRAFDAWCAERRHHRDTSHVSRRRGMLVLTARTPEDCRQWALDAARLDTTRFGTDHVYLDAWDRGHDGEIQIFRRFRPMVRIAEQARAQALSRADAPSIPSALREAVWDEAESVRGDAHLRIRGWSGNVPTLGAAAAEMLAHADVRTLDDLAEIGAVEAYRRLRAAEVKGLNLEMLWAMEGALTYRDRRWIDAGRRRELLAELGPAPVATPARRRRRYRTPVRSSHAVTVSARH